MLTQAKLLIEHNSTDRDTGFQVFVDGDPWSKLQVSGPDGAIVQVQPRGSPASLGLTQLFSESNEPANEDMPIPDMLDLLPGPRAPARKGDDGAGLEKFASLAGGFAPPL